MHVYMRVCTKSFLKNTTNSLCVCADSANKADSDSEITIFIGHFCIQPGLVLDIMEAQGKIHVGGPPPPMKST